MSKKSFGQRFNHTDFNSEVEELCKRVREFERENAMLRQENILLKSEVAGLRSRLGSLDASLDTDAIFHVTEWKEFRMPNWEIIKRSMKNPLFIYGRNVFDRKEIVSHNIAYLSIGR